MFIKIHNSVIKGVCALGGSGAEPSQSSLRDASSPEGGAFGVAGKFLITLDTLK